MCHSVLKMLKILDWCQHTNTLLKENSFGALRYINYCLNGCVLVVRLRQNEATVPHEKSLIECENI